MSEANMNSSSNSIDETLSDQLKSEIRKLLEAKEIKSALPMIMQGAHWGDTELQLLACRMLLHGEYGAPIRYPVGLEYARMAALNGEPEGMYELAMLYLEGRGCNKDIEKALYFLRKAADLNYGPALDQLGLLALQGRGLKKDLPLAKEYFLQAAKDEISAEKAKKHLAMLEAAEKKWPDLAKTNNNKEGSSK